MHAHERLLCLFGSFVSGLVNLTGLIAVPLVFFFCASQTFSKLIFQSLACRLLTYLSSFCNPIAGRCWIFKIPFMTDKFSLNFELLIYILAPTYGVCLQSTDFSPSQISFHLTISKTNLQSSAEVGMDSGEGYLVALAGS